MGNLASLATIIALGITGPGCSRSQAAPSSDAALFEPIAGVLMHPRCINCHQDDSPRQTDARIRHRPLVVRGADGQGSPAQRCQTCHQTKSSSDGFVPGAPSWRLAPLPMLWEGLTVPQLCAQMKDPARNGGRTGEHLIEHAENDPFVLWAWSPGMRRSSPPVSHAQFVKSIKAWVAAGMPCPPRASR